MASSQNESEEQLQAAHSGTLHWESNHTSGFPQLRISGMLSGQHAGRVVVRLSDGKRVQEVAMTVEDTKSILAVLSLLVSRCEP